MPRHGRDDPVQRPAAEPSEPGSSAWARHLRSALDGLSSDQRRSIELVYFGGLTQAQAASRLSLTAKAVARHVAAGLQTLSAVTGLDPIPARATTAATELASDPP